MTTDPNNGYSVFVRLVHWLTALIILGLTGLGWWMVGLSYYDSWYNRSLDLHKGFGIVALILGLAFIARKAFGPTPPAEATLTPAERAASKAVHGILFVMMLAMPLSGYVISTSSGDAVSVFGLFSVPAVAKSTADVRDLAVDIHYWLAYCGLAVIVLHAVAALKHHVIDKDRTLMRMLLGR